MQQFSPESFDKGDAANTDTFASMNIEEMSLDRTQEEISSFFGEKIKDARMLTGGQYLKLFKEGMEAGFSRDELESYLKEHGIEVRSVS